MKALKKSLLGAVCVTSIIGMAACSPQEEGRKVIEKPDGQITVIEEQPGNRAPADVAVKKIDTYEDIRGLDWMNDDTMLIGKENPEVGTISIEGETTYPTNLFVFEPATKSETVLVPEKMHQLIASYSPDRKHIFYKTNVEESATGYIMNADGTDVVQVTERGNIHPFDGAWVDNEHVIYSMDGIVYQTDVEGKSEKIADTGEWFVRNLMQAGKKLYFINNEQKLIEWELGGNKKRTVAENVVSVQASPDGTHFAMVRQASEDRMELVLMDSEFNEISKLAEENQVNGSYWSPDSTKVAYAVVSADGSNNGFFVADTATGKTTQISVTIEIGLNRAAWTPSGKKLFATVYKPAEQGVKLVTHVMTLQ